MEINAVKTYQRIIIGFLFVATSSLTMAEVQSYETTDNTGLNKLERLDTVDKYLVELSKSVKAMEAKLDENAKKIQSLDSIVKVLKENEAKLMTEKLGEQKKSRTKEEAKVSKDDLTEMEKLKADILALKNKDIEKIKVNVEELSDTVKAIQATLKDRK